MSGADDLTLLEAKAALREMEGWKIHVDVASLARSWRIFHGNSAELEIVLAEAETMPCALELWSTNNGALEDHPEEEAHARLVVDDQDRSHETDPPLVP